jgi:hypothetical protein
MSYLDNVILDAHGNQLKPEHNEYPSSGLPLPQEGITLNREPSVASFEILYY